MTAPPKKKQKNDPSLPAIIHDKHTLDRMHYLLHLARLCCLHACSIRHSNKDMVLNEAFMSRVYIKAMRSLASKMTVPMTAQVKATFCKHCNLFMFDGLTCMSMVSSGNDTDSKNKYYERTCFGCGTTKRWRLSPGERSLVGF